jgi:hypothetical protein
MHENKKMFFLMFWRKPGILIPDVYFYDVKIQTNIKQNLIKKIRGRITNFWKYFWIFFWTELDPAHSFWIGPDLSGQWTVEHSPLFTCYVTVESELIHSPLFTQNSGDGAAKKKKEEGRKADLRWRWSGWREGQCGVSGGSGGGRRWLRQKEK